MQHIYSWYHESRSVRTLSISTHKMKTEKQLEDQLWRVAQKLREKGNVNTLVKLYKRATDDITRFYLTYNISKVM